MYPSDLLPFCVESIRAREPVLIVGEPGIGKSDIIAQACVQAGAHHLISHPPVEDPTDKRGLPWPDADAGNARFLPFGDLATATSWDPDGPTLVWNLEDLGHASPAVQAGNMQLLLARRVGEHVLPDNVTFIASSNRRTRGMGVTGMLEPVKSRMTIVDLVPSVDDWCTWAIGRELPPEIIAFLRFRPDLLFQHEATSDMVNQPSPRTWATLSRWFARGVRAHEIFAGCVGKGAASELRAFLSMWATLPNIDAILASPDSAPLHNDPSTLYAVCTALASKATRKTFAAIGTYATRLVRAASGEYGALLIRDCIQRDPSLAETSTFVELHTGPFADLIGGAT